MVDFFGSVRNEDAGMSFDVDAARRAVRALLEAVGVDPDSDELRQTPELVAEALRDELLDGYSVDVSDVVSDTFPVESPGMVVVGDIGFSSMCPHHLLPYRGTVSLGYLPADQVVGIGRLPRLVDAFAHRLILQEELANSIAEALVDELGAEGAAVRVEAHQDCMELRGPKRQANVIAHAWRGSFAQNESLRAEFLATLGALAEGASDG